MADFKHSDIGSIRCPLHNQREVFEAGTIIQPSNLALVRYPCGYVDGLAQKMGMEPAVPVPSQDELWNELATRIKRLEERSVPRRAAPRTTPRPEQPTAPKEPTIMEQYGNPNK